MKPARTMSLLLALALIFSILPVAAQNRQPDIERRINALLARMTLAEKLGQLQQLDGEANGNFRPEHLDLVRKGLLGSTLNVRGVARANQLQHTAVDESRLKIPLLFGFDVMNPLMTLSATKQLTIHEATRLLCSCVRAGFMSEDESSACNDKRCGLRGSVAVVY